MSIRDGRLFCGKCGRQYEHTADDEIELLEHAQNDGWAYGYQGDMEGDICPKCQATEGAAI